MSAKTNLVLDLAITAAFLVVSSPPLTGMAVHEWLGLSYAVAILVHLLFHWDWVVTVTTRFLGTLRSGLRLSYVVDLVLFVALTAAVLSGLLMSKHVLPVLGVAPVSGRQWRGIHELAANVSVAAVAVHIGLHWTWLAFHLRRLCGIGARVDVRQTLSPAQGGGPA